jgi:ATP-dependent helicase/nuclease subunit A
MGKAFTRTTEQLAAGNPGRSVWVLANAGSGKTHVLVDRVVRLMLDEARPDSILCLTFTKAAAAEMSLRLFNLLSGWIALDDEALRLVLRALGERDVGTVRVARARQLFAVAIETPGGLKIQTIHAFCEKLLQLFPVESGLAPGFRVMDETDRMALLRRATEQALASAAADADEGILLLEDGGITTREAFEDLAKRFLSATSALRGVLNGNIDLDAMDSALRAACGADAFASTTEVEREIAASDWQGFAKVGQDFARVSSFHRRDIGEMLRGIAIAPTLAEKIDRLTDLLFTDGAPRGRGLYAKKTQTEHPESCRWIDAMVQPASHLLTMRALSLKVDATLALITLMRRVDQRFLALKSAEGLYDFDDLIMRTSALLQHSSAAHWVLYKLDGNLAHVLVDEAQDTSPEQWEIIKRIADEFFAGAGLARREPRTVFVVGDIKQSIYSFQGADTVAFQDAQLHFARRLRDSGQVLDDVKLTVSYRSLPVVLHVVDIVFGKDTEASKGLGAEADSSIHEPSRRDDGPGTVELWPLFKPLEDEERDIWMAPVDRLPDLAPRKRLARHLAETISNWIGKRLLPSKNRPVEAGDVLILLQSRNELFDALIAELRQRKVAVAGADRLKLRESIAVLDIVALAQFCLLPEDDLSLACVLKSPLLPEPMDDAQLTGIAAARKTSLWRAVQARCAGSANLDWLESCCRRAATAGPHAFLAAILTRFRKAMSARLGEEALDATNTLLDVALTFEREEGTSVAAFLHWFMAREEDVKRDLETGGGQLRIMTVHGAKGLEGNIVILPDAADMPGPRSGSRLLTTPAIGNTNIRLPFFDVVTDVRPPDIETWRDDEKQKAVAEKKRLLYVAMTRARDELYVTGSLGRASNGKPASLSADSWYGLMRQAFDRPESQDHPRIIENLHPEGPVERWGADPVAAQQTNTGLQFPSFVLPDWTRQMATAAPRQPRAVAITALAQGDARLFDRAAAERGLAVHALLEHLDATIPLLEVQRRAAKRKLEPELATALHGLLQRPDLARYFAADARTEAAIAGHVDGLALPVRGVVDRLVVEKEQIWLMDYKSGRRPAQTPVTYLRQMAGYGAVLALAFPGRTINAALLWTHSGDLQILDSEALSRVLEAMKAEEATKVA